MGKSTKIGSVNKRAILLAFALAIPLMGIGATLLRIHQDEVTYARNMEISHAPSDATLRIHKENGTTIYEKCVNGWRSRSAHPSDFDGGSFEASGISVVDPAAALGQMVIQ